MIRIVLADDHVIVRDGFRQLLAQEPDFTIIGEAGDGATAVELVERLHPDVLILDIVMPGLKGLEVLRRVRPFWPEARVVILSMYDDEGYVLRAFEAGAMAYVLKESNTSELVRAIRLAMMGQHYLSTPLVEHVITAYLRHEKVVATDPCTMLSTRERDILQRLGAGQDNCEIATALALSQRTVETYRRRMLKKLHLRSQADLLRYALSHDRPMSERTLPPA